MHFIGNLFTIYDQSGEGNIDRTIIECLLREESYDSISESCFVTVSTIKYRVKKMIGTAEAADRRDLIRLLREYLP